MAKTTINNSANNDSLPPPAGIPGLHRAFDPTTLAFRHGSAIELDDIISNHAIHNYPSSSRAASSTADPTDTIWSSQRASSGTKPTSNGTSYPGLRYNGNGKEAIIYASSSSMSATHGSGSDTEREVVRDERLLGLGSWAGVAPARAPRKVNKHAKKAKKPVVIVQHDGPASVSEDEEESTEQVTYSNGKDAKYLRQRRNKTNDELGLAEEGGVSGKSTDSRPVPLSNPRIVAMVVFAIAILLTLSICTWAISHTGKHRMGCTKGIILGATVLIFIFTAGLMVAARRVLMEVLLMALVEFLAGSVLLIEIGELMQH